MSLRYCQSETEIRIGDRVLYKGEPGEIELVVATETGDPAVDWYLQEYGGGVMVREPKVHGRVFIPVDQVEEAHGLEFMARAELDGINIERTE